MLVMCLCKLYIPIIKIIHNYWELVSNTLKTTTNNYKSIKVINNIKIQNT